MNPREIFNKTLKFNLAECDRMNMIEWAPWWNLTYARWKEEGLEVENDIFEMNEYFGLDTMYLLNGSSKGRNLPQTQYTGGSIIESEKDYEKLLHCLYQDESIKAMIADAKSVEEKHDKGEIIVRLWLDGFFWHPRDLFGIEQHFYAFYDNPELMHRINRNLLEYNKKVVEALLKVLKPDVVALSEDMSYNHGPMLSDKLFTEFIKPYYIDFVESFKKERLNIFVDSDGDISKVVPWLIDCGISGIYPLERQSNVDVCALRKKYPKFLMMGGFDKRVISKGEECVRAEFERIFPAMISGGYIPSVDHQTPPDASLDDYRIFVKLVKEYTEKATKRID